MVGHARAAPKKLQAGDLVGGKFVVERTIGSGGMGQVLVARHQELGTRVAVKVVHAEAARDPDNIARFKREARAMARLSSEHVVRVYDVGEMESGLPYLIMEHLEGRDLGSMLAERGPLPVDDVIGWMIQACEALVEAHENNIIHRDLKPQNLFVSRRASRALDTEPEGHLRVLDFGLAKPFQGLGSGGPPESMKLTRPGEVVGTSHYMAPEQVRGDDLDGRVDVWAAGACLFRLLTAQYPFGGGVPALVCASILGQPPGNLRALRPEVSGPLDAIVTRCLQKRREDRYASMRELMVALQSVKRSGSRSSLTAAMPAAVREQVTSMLAQRSSASLPAAPSSTALDAADPTIRTAAPVPFGPTTLPTAPPPLGPPRGGSSPAYGTPPAFSAGGTELMRAATRPSMPSYPRASLPPEGSAWSQAPTSGRPPSVRRRSALLVVLVAVWALVAVAAAAFFFFRRRV